MIIFIDNYDSFTYNLVQAFAALGADIRVFRNDEITAEAAAALNPSGIVISPGPGGPTRAGISVELIRNASGTIPILGVCLGHQCIGAAFGARIGNAKRIMHGKVSAITHAESKLYEGLENPFPAGRYHSLAVLPDSIPSDLLVDATSEDGEIMGIRHRTHPTFGVQFHPESVLTPAGPKLLANFLRIVREHSRSAPCSAPEMIV